MTHPLLIPLPAALDGPRIRLRPLRPEDAPALWAAVAETREQLALWLPWVQSYQSEADARAFIARARARWLQRQDLNLGIFARADDRFLGGCALHPRDWQQRCFELGYWLRRSAWGRGYAQEAVQLLTRLCFGPLQAARLEIRMDPRNRRSRHVAERLGFVLEGTLRRCAVDGAGQPSDRHVFALLPEEFARLPWAAQG